MLLKEHDESLLEEDDRLELLDKRTTIWWEEVERRMKLDEF